MRLTTLILPLVLFTGVLVGLQNFGAEMYEGHGIEGSHGFESVEGQHEEMESEWTEEGSQESTFTEEEGIVERAAGALLIPRIASNIVGVAGNFNTIIDDVSEYRWVPDWAVTTGTTVVYVSVFFALVGAFIRHRT